MKKVAPFEGKKLALFDLDGTLRETHPNGFDAFFDFGVEAGIEFDETQRHKIMRWTYKYWADVDVVRRDQNQLEEGKFWENYVRQQVSASGVNGEQAERAASKIYAHFREDFSPEPYVVPGAKELLWALRSAGVGTGLVSNRSEPLTGLAIELGIIEHFDFTLSAGQANSWKPDKSIFRIALSMGDEARPDEAVYIGDNYFADVLGALGAGIDAVLIDKEGVFPEAQKECIVVSQLGDLEPYVSAPM